MPFSGNRKFLIFAAASLLIIFIGLFIAVFERDDEKKEPVGKVPAETSPESFTFFDLDANTVFNDDIREKLRSKLGSDAIEYWSPVDLKINHGDFLKEYFRDLYELDQRLNPEEGLRFEHNTIKLTYRYARKKKLPFDYVMLIFSNYTKKPLFFKISATKEAADVVGALKKKYGEPGDIHWDRGKAKSLYWEKNKDVLITSVIEDIFGNPEYHIMIYYVNNIEKLLSREQKEKEARIEERRKAGETAF
jgi:hypothetical protein